MNEIIVKPNFEVCGRRNVTFSFVLSQKSANIAADVGTVISEGKDFILHTEDKNEWIIYSGDSAIDNEGTVTKFASDTEKKISLSFAIMSFDCVTEFKFNATFEIESIRLLDERTLENPVLERNQPEK